MSASVTSLNMTSPVPVGEQRFIPARFRVFANYDLGKWGVEGKEVQPGLWRAWMYQIFMGGFWRMITTPSDNESGSGFDPGAGLDSVYGVAGPTRSGSDFFQR